VLRSIFLPHISEGAFSEPTEKIGTGIARDIVGHEFYRSCSGAEQEFVKIPALLKPFATKA
jgi:hypothetical protein